MGSELATRPPDQFIALFERAIDKGMDGAGIRELLTARREYEADEAKKAYAVAITKFQEMSPRIMKQHRADVGGKFSYEFASFDDIMRAISPALTECELAISFTTAANLTAPKMMTVIAIIRHGIHEEQRPFTFPIPEMSVNETQRFGAALSYGRRYALSMALNLTTTDRDDDARGLADVITEDQLKELNELLVRKSRTAAQLIKYMNLSEDTQLSEISSRSAAIAKDTLMRMPDGGRS